MGTRTDIHTAIDLLKLCTSMCHLVETMPGTVAGAYRMLGDYRKQTRLLDAKDKVLVTYEHVIWKPFQQQILDLVNSKADGRTLNWFHEPIGNTFPSVRQY